MTTPTSLPTFTPTPGCVVPGAAGDLLILHNDIFGNQGPNGPELDRHLADAFPQWESFQQKLEWRDEPASAGQVVDDASFAATFELNPAVTLVTVGMQLGWRLPLNGDLFTLARAAGRNLELLFWDHVFDEGGVQGRYPEVANAGTYAIYAFFEYDQAALQEWCETYIQLFGQSPLSPPE